MESAFKILFLYVSKSFRSVAELEGKGQGDLPNAAPIFCHTATLEKSFWVSVSNGNKQSSPGNLTNISNKRRFEWMISSLLILLIMSSSPKSTFTMR